MSRSGWVEGQRIVDESKRGNVMVATATVIATAAGGAGHDAGGEDVFGI